MNKEDKVVFYYRHDGSGTFGDGWIYQISLTENKEESANIASFCLPSENALLGWDKATELQKLYIEEWGYEVKDGNNLLKNGFPAGKFLGVYSEELATKKTLRPDSVKICARCGKEFEKYKNAKYCEHCRKEIAENAEKERKARSDAWFKGSERTCLRCGKTYLGKTTAKYCPECREVIKKENLDELNRVNREKKHDSKTKHEKMVEKCYRELERAKKVPTKSGVSHCVLVPAVSPQLDLTWCRKQYLEPFIDLCRQAEAQRSVGEEYPYVELTDKLEEVIQKVSKSPDSVASMVKMKKF